MSLGDDGPRPAESIIAHNERRVIEAAADLDARLQLLPEYGLREPRSDRNINRRRQRLAALRDQINTYLGLDEPK